MAIATGRSLTRGGMYLVRRVKQIALALAVKGGVSSRTEIIGGYLLRATAAGGRGVGTVIEPPSALILQYATGGVGGDVAAYPYQTRDWYDSRVGLPDETLPRTALPEPELRITRALYSWPSADLDTPIGGLFPRRTKPWSSAGVEARYSVSFCATLIAEYPVTFVEASPFGLSPTAPYGVELQLFFGGQRPLQIHIDQRYLRHHVGNDWRFGPYMAKPVDLRAAWPVSRSAQMRRGSYDTVVVSSTYQDAAGVSGVLDMLTHPRPGLFLLVHSQTKMLAAFKTKEPEEQAFEDGLLWQRHYVLSDLFPILSQQPYICAPRGNFDYTFNGDGNPERASEAYKVWVQGYYTGEVPPVNVGRLPCTINRLCVASTDDRIIALAGVTFFTCADWFDMGDTRFGPLQDSQLFCCNALVRLQWSHDGELLDSQIFDLDSTAASDQIAFDGLGMLGRPTTRSLFAQPCALLVVQGQALELTQEWRETRVPRSFSVYPYRTLDIPVIPAESGLRVRWAGKNLFFPISETGVFAWSKLLPENPPFALSVVREMPEVDAPGAVQISPTQIAFVGYRLTPVGRLVLCVIDVEAETFEVRSEIGAPGEPLTYLPPHPPNTIYAEQYQSPPTLSVAQQVITQDGETLVEGLILFSFHSRYPHSLVSRDSGRSWKVHITNAQSFCGVFYAPSVLRADYATGTAVTTPKEPS